MEWKREEENLPNFSINMVDKKKVQANKDA